jgi:predicted  nucleic acid-binding Zn-ribbon protein
MTTGDLSGGAVILRALIELSNLDAEQARAASGIEGMEERRRTASAALPTELATLYETLLRIDRRPAVVPMRAGYCAGCHLKVPTQLLIRLAGSYRVSPCPHCQRMLYDPGALEAARG